MATGGEHGILLLKTEERGLRLHLVVDDRLELGAGVGRVGAAIGVEDLAHDEDIVTTTNGIRADKDGVEDAIRVVTLGLTGGGAIKGPGREVLGVEGGDRLLDDLGLGAHLVEHGSLGRLAFLAIVPDVLGSLSDGINTEDSNTTLRR